MQDYNTSATTDLFTEEPVIYGTFWQRFAAAIVDGLILIIPNYIIVLTVREGFGDILSLVMYWLYDALQESGPKQATIGKKVLGLKVTNTTGHRISFGLATIRFFGKFVSAIILFIGYLMMLWDEKRQTLHDKMAGTLVVAA
jgi:uncharacterized RDD family membrane protein YckC